MTKKNSRPIQSLRMQKAIARAWHDQCSRLPQPKLNADTLNSLGRIRRMAAQESDTDLLIAVLDLTDIWRARDNYTAQQFQQWCQQQTDGERALTRRNIQARLDRDDLLQRAESLRHPGGRTRGWMEVATTIAKAECAADWNLNEDKDHIEKRAKAIYRRIMRAQAAKKSARTTL